ncbi:MAG: hypothetical protein OEV73_02455, partial [Desulfobulbaceae bacterium]|nr:hypothetical protein [Desulfobulbaceae bacterium]
PFGSFTQIKVHAIHNPTWQRIIPNISERGYRALERKVKSLSGKKYIHFFNLYYQRDKNTPLKHINRQPLPHDGACWIKQYLNSRNTSH